MNDSVDYISGIDGAPAAVGPYSQATLVSGGLIFCSGQIALNPETAKMVEGDIKEQTEQVLKNLSALLAGLDCNVTNIAKATIFLTSIQDFSTVNELYAAWLGDVKPARSTVEVAALPLGAVVEIELIVATQVV